MTEEEEELWTVAGVLIRNMSIRAKMANHILQRSPIEHTMNLRRGSEHVFKEYMEDAAAILQAIDKLRAKRSA